MMEAVSLTVFAGIVYLFLVVIPTIVEKFSSEEFRASYQMHLGDKHIHSFGK